MKYKNEKLYIKILENIRENSKITECELAIKFDVSERTIRRYFKELKDNNKIKMVRIGKIREWHIL